MINKSFIQRNLLILDKKYKNASLQQDCLFFSKLAILELCGWIEESIDLMVTDLASKKIKNSSNLKIINQAIKRNYGFDYDKHFRNLLIQLIGLINFEKLESKMDSSKLQLLISSLETLTQIRNSLAHTHIKGVTTQINSPSITLSQFSNVYNGLKEAEKALRSIKI